MYTFKTSLKIHLHNDIQLPAFKDTSTISSFIFLKNKMKHESFRRGSTQTRLNVALLEVLQQTNCKLSYFFILILFSKTKDCMKVLSASMFYQYLDHFCNFCLILLVHPVKPHCVFWTRVLWRLMSFLGLVFRDSI